MLKRLLFVVPLVAGLMAFAEPAVPSAVYAASPRTYNVLVGWEDASRGVDIEAYFPDTLHIHVGDTVHWKQNTNEIHTVTFLAGTPMPDVIVPAPSGLASPLMFNPQAAFPAAPANGQYDGSTYANSGIMGREPGQPQDFSLTFTKPGTYAYLCLVHGEMMSGKVVVEDGSASLSTLEDVAQQAQRMIGRTLAQLPAAIRAAKAQMQAPTRNPDGTTTYHVKIGYAIGQIDLMRFFPRRLVVRPGDTVEWSLSAANMAPHTVTFLNGGPDIPVTLFVPPPQGPLLLINPAVLAPQNAGQPLTRQGVFSSGLLTPGGPTSFSLKIGDISGVVPYECLLHDASGMTGTLVVVPRD